MHQINNDKPRSMSRRALLTAAHESDTALTVAAVSQLDVHINSTSCYSFTAFHLAVESVVFVVASHIEINVQMLHLRINKVLRQQQQKFAMAY